MDNSHFEEAECITKFESYIQSGDTLRQASKKVGKTLIELRKAYAKTCRDWPSRPDIKEKIRREIEGLIDKGWSQAKIASAYNLKKSTLSNWVYEWDLSDCFIRKGPRRTMLNAEEKSREVMAYIKRSGGSVNKAIKALGIAISVKTVKKYAEKHGFDLEAYRLAYQKYGMWEIQPGRALQIYTKDYIVSAKCSACNQIFDVTLVNLKSGKSKSCQRCSSKGVAKKVKCLETGETYKSIRSWTKAIGELKRYQKLHLKLVKTKQYTHDGQTYELID